jgi:hypothetical protein
LAPREVRVARRRGLLRGTAVESRVLPCNPDFGAQPWDGAVAALKDCDAALRASVVLSNHFVRYAVVPWSDALDSEVEEEAYVRHHFARIHGERAAAWATRWTDSGDTRLASAIDRALLDALKQALPRLASVQPYLMTAINRCRKAIPRNGAWLALVEDERACIALHAGGGWRSVQNARGPWLDLLERERHRAEGPVPGLALVVGAHVDGEVAGWRFEELSGGLAH